MTLYSHRDGFAKRMRAIEVTAGVSSPSDQKSLQHRLSAAETAASVTANPNGGLDARMSKLEDTLTP